MSDEEWAKAIIIHLTGKPEYPSPTLLKIVADIRMEGYEEAGVIHDGPKI